MSNWYKLKLPPVPTKSNVDLRKFSGTGLWNIYTNPLSILNDELVKNLQELGAEPDIIVVFESIEQQRTNFFVHKDLTWKQNRWKTVPCAINWELQPVSTTVSWFDTSNCKEYWPEADFLNTEWPRNFLNSVSYSDNILNFGIPNGSELIQQAAIDETTPILFRTDIAHGVEFKSQTLDRFMLSLRFKNISSWEHAVEIFRKVIVDSN